jgi:hypothetical protein
MPIQPFLHLPPPVTLSSFEHVTSYMRRVLEALQALRLGKTANVGEFTLTANAASSTLSDIRISPQSVIAWHPRTANAAAEIAAGTMFITDANMSNGSAIVTHANNAQADRSFRYAVIG